MHKNKTYLAIIPARAGSKRLVGKNIRILAGKPLIAWSIEQALKSKYIDKLIVSTESEAIAAVAKDYGAEVPFLRPKYLATDNTKSIDVVLHALQYLENSGRFFDKVMLLQPTSPLRSSADIDASIKWSSVRRAPSIISVCPSEHNPLWANRLPFDYKMDNFIKLEAKAQNKKRNLGFYRLNGAIYLSDCDYLKKQKSFFGKKSIAFLMPQARSVDIDNKIDFEFAEFLKLKYRF